MLSLKVKKEFNRIIAGTVAAAMTLTMTPDIWLPVHAEIVRNQIINDDIQSSENTADFNADGITLGTSGLSGLEGYDYEEYEFNGNKYAYFSNNIQWEEAKELCESIGGHLVYINSPEEQDFIHGIIRTNYTAMGGWDEPHEGIWTWLDESEMTYTNWSSGEPNNGWGRGDQDHLFIYSSGKWDDGFYGVTAPFICEWDSEAPVIKNEKLYEYAVFSANQNEDMYLNGWKGNFVGGIYSGKNFICNLSEFYLDGKTDTVGTTTANGWQISIPEKNENIEAIPMPDLEEAILAKAGEYEYHSESPAYVQDTNIINGSIMVSGDVIISGTNFEGDCYIIADRDITYNVNNLNTTGRLVLYSRNGNITVNGTNININGIMYAPKGRVSFNANETNVNGRVWADTVNFSGSIFNVKASESDLELIGNVDIPTEYSVLSQGNSIYGYKKDFVDDEWSTGPSTTFGNKMIELVPDQYHKIGYSYYKIGKCSEGSFSARFTFSIDFTTEQADGVAFVIQKDSSTPGGDGFDIGYGGISPSVAIEFDNYRNVWDINTYHAGVMINGDPSRHYAICNYEPLKVNGSINDVWIEYDGVNKMLYVSAAPYNEEGKVFKPEQALLSYNIDLEQLFGGSDHIYFGVTSATGNCKASHKLHGVEFDPDPDTLYYAKNETEEPVITVTPSSESVTEGAEAYFTVNTTLADKISSIEYTLNGKAVTVSGGKYTLDTSAAGVYTFAAEAVTSSGKTITGSAEITVKKQSIPTVDLMFDKDSYKAGDDVTVTVVANDENGIGGMALEYDGAQVQLDENNSYTIEGITAGAHTLVGIAWNTDGVVASAGYEIEISPVSETDNVPPELTVSCEKLEIFVGETLPIYINASDDSGEVFVTVTVNGEEVPYDNSGIFSFTGGTYGIYEIMVYASDAAGNKRWDGVNIAVNVKDQDFSAPTVDIVLDKEIYYENDDIIFTVNAEDNVGVDRVTVTVDSSEILPGENGKYIIENISIGTYEIEATAYDKAGNSSRAAMSVPVNKRGEVYDELTLDVSVDPKTVHIGKPFDIVITAEGGLGEKTISCDINGEDILVENSKAVYTPDKAGEYIVRVTATDEAGNSITSTQTLTISESGTEIGGGSEEKIVSASLIINDDRLNDGEQTQANVGDEVSVYVEIINLPDSEIESISVTVNGEEISLDSDKKAVYIPEKAGEYLFNAVIKAKDGNVLDLKYMLYVTEKGSGDEDDDIADDILFVDITSPEDVKEITAPTDIIGFAKGSGLVKYTLEYAPADTGDYVKICENTSSVDGDVLGKIDPTMLRNGYYDIRLTGYTDKAHKSDTVTVYVTGQMKIGNFSIAFQDMDVNVPGLALTVVRGYDSRDRNVSGDFGYGWNLSLTGADISESGKPSENWSQTQGSGMVSTFRFSEDKAHEVSIDWGNGKKDKFRMSLSPNSSLTPITAGITVSYKVQSGTTSTLEPINSSSSALIYNSGLLMYADGTPYAPTGYKLTKRDGTVYYFDSEGNVNKITDTNGNTIEITHDGIIHSGGKSIVFDRDGEDRITAITSPTGKSVEYTYDGSGDLVSVKDISGYVTKFEYDEHYITNIIDPRGVNVTRNIYDDNGRLIKTVDSDGNEIVYDHDIDGRQEVITDRNGNVTLYIYDDKGNVLSQTDPNGNTVKNSYDENGNLDKTIDALGNVTDYGYSAGGDLLSLTDAEGHTVNNSYNSKGQLTSINAMGINTIRVQYDDKGNTLSTTDALGNDIDYAYDSKGQLTSVTDEIGVYMNMTYDSEGNVVSATNGAGTTSQFAYDADGNCTSKTLTYTTEEGVKTVTEQYFYDAAGNLIKIIDSEGNVTTTEYNSMGKVSSATDEKGRKTAYEYDDFGNTTKITYPDNTAETFTYDREGNNLTATDRMGRTVTMTYDKVGNLTAKTYPNGAKVTYAYDKNYNLISETSASGGVTSYEYDMIGRNTAIVDALGNRTVFFYNAKSQLESMTDPMGRTYTYSYDDNGNRIKTTYPNGTSVSTEYDARGRITKQSDQHGYNTTYVCDGADNLISVTNAQGVTTSYTYDEVGNMTSVTDGNGNVTKYSYDEFGRVVKTTNALGNCAYTTYDVSGNVLTSTDYAGNVTTYTYDNLDRLTGKTNNDGTVNYTYTVDGKISTVTDSNGVTMFTYDNMDGLTRVDYPDGNYVAYSYDNACRLTKVTTPFGSTSYEYDLLDRLTRVVDRNGYATAYEYDKNGNRTRVTYANGYTTTYDYDLLNRLIRQETVDNDGETVVQYVYTLGAAGERKAVSELDRTVEYTYDNLYRLISETITEGEKITVYTYAYDNVSNRILKTVDGAETVYTYNALNQLISDSDTSYEYDLNGNLIRVIGTGNSALYEYNCENKLVKATVQSGNNVIVETYTYDYSGNRTSKTTNTNGSVEYVKYLNDNSNLTNVLAEIDETGTVKCIYTLGADLISQECDGKVSVYIYDGHGSVVGLAAMNGKVTDTYKYDAFGNLIKSTGSTVNNYKYCGEQTDSTTGLYYLRARYMDTSTGRFISQDSYAGSISDPVSLHKYLYANSNPVTYSDPSGYSVENDIYYYQETWLSIEEASNYIIQLGTCIGNEAAYNQRVLEIGKDLIHRLLILKIEYCLASLLEYVFDPLTAREIASGIVNSLDFVMQFREKLSQKLLPEKKTSGGRLGNQATRDLNHKIAEILDKYGYTVIGGGNKYNPEYPNEEYLPPIGGKGRKGGNYIDITVEKDGVKIRINTVDVYVNGDLKSREETAKRNIERKIGDELITIPKNATMGEVMEILRKAGLIP